MGRVGGTRQVRLEEERGLGRASRVKGVGRGVRVLEVRERVGVRRG